VRTISMTALRRLVIGAQGYATRSRRGGCADELDGQPVFDPTAR